ncbi:MAG: glycosyltransferase, partial [Magnetococcales bacterium]|nr:glycosyltransferase [Magnetococcales bacterium]
MRILHLLDHSLPRQSGYATRTDAILHQQRAMGWEPVPLTGPRQESGELPTELVGDVNYGRTPAPKGLASIGWFRPYGDMMAMERRMLDVVPMIQPHLIHAHSPLLNGRAALAVGKALRIPVVYEVRALWEDAAVSHGTTSVGSLRYRLTRYYESDLLRAADAVITLCEGLRGEIVQRGVKPEKVFLLPNGVALDPPVEPPPEAIQRFAQNAPGPVLGFIGSFYAYEGLPGLLEALTLLHARGVAASVLLVGGGPEEGAVRRLVERHPLRGR